MKDVLDKLKTELLEMRMLYPGGYHSDMGDDPDTFDKGYRYAIDEVLNWIKQERKA